MRVAGAIILAALLSVAYAQATGKCNGLNITMNPGLQPFTTAAGVPATTLTQACPYGFYSDPSQGGRCITYRQGVNNYFDAPCYAHSDCGVGAPGSLPLACGRDKKCTWYQTRQLDDSCTDSLNCRTYQALNGSTVSLGCSVTTKKCAPFVHVLGATNARCNYTVGNEMYMCDDANTCKYFNQQDSVSQAGTYGAGYCTPLRALNDVCINTVDPAQYKFANLWCANKQACFGQFPNNRTCVTPRNAGDTCYQFGQLYECAAGLYCNGDDKQCKAFAAVATNCTGNYFENPTTGNICQMGLRCITNPTLGYKQCAAAAAVGGLCTTAAGINAGNNCTAGLQCISQPVRGQFSQICSAGANGDICQLYTPGPPTTLIDSCQAGLFCQVLAPANFTCIPKFTIGSSCNVSNQCADGTTCYNSTCTAYQNEGQVCNELTTQPLNYLKCNPSLQCSRGVCIQNYTVGINGFCSQDMDCENAHCDVVLKRCTRRKLCSSNAMCPSGSCVCSAGSDNMGQCVLNTCGKSSNALRKCLNPLDFDAYSNSTYYLDPYLNAMGSSFAFLDSGSSYYQKCSGQHNDYVRCRGMMAKWGAPAVPLGDFINYDLATVSASSSVSVSIVAMIAFVMTVVMNL